jgi:hypothetical protein
MNHITSNLYLGSWVDARKHRTSNEWTIVTIADACPEVGDYQFYVHDGGNYLADPEQLKFAVDKVVELLGSKKKLLVHCHSGINRSPAVVIGVLMKVNNWSLQEAYNFVLSKRKISPFDQLLRLACAAVGKNIDIEPFQKLPYLFNKEEQVVEDAYQKVLGRSVDPDGLQVYSTLLQNGKITPATLEEHLKNSIEYKTKTPGRA